MNPSGNFLSMQIHDLAISSEGGKIGKDMALKGDLRGLATAQKGNGRASLGEKEFLGGSKKPGKESVISTA
jgi:hypothetical protein